jgi:hypothetical protein
VHIRSCPAPPPAAILERSPLRLGGRSVDELLLGSCGVAGRGTSARDAATAPTPQLEARLDVDTPRAQDSAALEAAPVAR